MLKFSIVVAMSNNRAIGANNKLLWHLPNDLKHFKSVTMSKPIVMGRKTFSSIGRPLPGRDNLVITSDKNFLDKLSIDNNIKKNIYTFNNISGLLEHLNKTSSPDQDKEIMIIGGGEIYRQFLPMADKIYLTIVDADIEADVFFPELDDSWQEVKQELYLKDERHKYNYRLTELVKKLY